MTVWLNISIRNKVNNRLDTRRKLHWWLQIANSIQLDADLAGLASSKEVASQVQHDVQTLISRFDQVVTSAEIRLVSRQLFADGHYTRAVEAAFKTLIIAVKTRSNLSDDDYDGHSLMQKAFSVNNPKLKFSGLSRKSEKNVQLGYMELFAGSISGIRNPRAHEVDIADDPQEALELLTLANHLMRKLATTHITNTKK